MKRTPMNLVVGASGMLGLEVCQRLTSRHQNVTALVRPGTDPGKVARLQALGVEIRRGDLRDPGSLEAACAGTSTVIATASSMPFSYAPHDNTPFTTDRDGMGNLIAAAQHARVRHFVHISFSGAIDADFPLREAKRAAEERLRASGLAYTILRPNFFMEVWLSPAVGFDPAHARATIYGEGRNPLAWIAVRDVAEYAVASLAHPAALNASIELGGPEALSPREVVGIFERAAGRAFTLEYVSEADLAAREAAATDPMQRSFAALMRAYARGAVGDATAQQALNLRQTSVVDFAQQTMRMQEGGIHATL